MKTAGVNNTWPWRSLLFLFVLHPFVPNETISPNEPATHNELALTVAFVLALSKQRHKFHMNQTEGALWSVPFTEAFLKYLISVHACR